MNIFSQLFQLLRRSDGRVALTFKRAGVSIILEQDELDELFKFLGPLQEGQRVAWLRDLDGTGSLHPCREGDPGAMMFVGPPC